MQSIWYIFRSNKASTLPFLPKVQTRLCPTDRCITTVNVSQFYCRNKETLTRCNADKMLLQRQVHNMRSCRVGGKKNAKIELNILPALTICSNLELNLSAMEEDEFYLFKSEEQHRAWSSKCVYQTNTENTIGKYLFSLWIYIYIILVFFTSILWQWRLHNTDKLANLINCNRYNRGIYFVLCPTLWR